MEADAGARPLATAGVLVLDADGHVLIVEPLHHARWEIPGGALRHGESPRAACARALRETLGLELAPGRLLIVDWAARVAEEQVHFLFDGGALDDDVLDALVLSPEVESWACVPAEELFVMLAPERNRQVGAALDALASGETWYLENGTRA